MSAPKTRHVATVGVAVLVELIGVDVPCGRQVEVEVILGELLHLLRLRSIQQAKNGI